jgi:heme/copper-type cytochrome/quinol oxidase subunit 2
LGAEWNPPDRIARAVIGKQWAWEFLYSVERGEWNRACELLNFLEKANNNPLFAECFWLSPDGKINLSDPGNGEQTSWYVWAISRARKILEGKKLLW